MRSPSPAEVVPPYLRTRKHNPDVTPTECGCGECRSKVGKKPARQPRQLKHPMHNPARMVALTKLMRETAMRLSDGLAFDVSKAVTLDEGTAGGVVAYTYLPHNTTDGATSVCRPLNFESTNGATVYTDQFYGLQNRIQDSKEKLNENQCG